MCKSMNTSTTPTTRFTKKRKEPTSMKKSVSFLPSVLVYRTLHINDYTDEEVEKTWYDGDEMADIVNNCVKIIASLDNMSSEDCFRGLEVRTPEAQKKRTTHRFCAIDTVLGEQESQWQNQEDDIQKIRQCYMAYSKVSEAEAYRVGLLDAEEAMNIYQEGDSCSLCLEPKRRKRLSSSDRRCVRPQTQVSSIMTLSQQMKFHSPIGRAA